jgi:hypothetical protein
MKLTSQMPSSMRSRGDGRALQNPVEIGVAEGWGTADQKRPREHVDHLLVRGEQGNRFRLTMGGGV